jgi:cell wall-associated NlpC family hydrolase
MFGCALAALALAACGSSGSPSDPRPATHATDPKPQSSGGVVSSAVASSSAGKRPGAAKEVADPLEADSYPAPASVRHSAAKAPVKAGEAIVAAGAPSNAEVRKELQQMQAVERSARQTQQRTLTAVPGGESIGGNGTIPIPSGVPEVVQKVIAGANEIADFPYVYGGGHASFIDNAYDCSGSVSYALAAGGLLSAPETSGELESWGVPGPGKYITVYANAGHTYMYVDGMLYDTAGRSGVYASRWQVEPTDNAGYVVRHWPGL